MKMKERLQEIIRYKTGGRQNKFAALMGWSPQYLAKLLRGESFGVAPVISLLNALPEINARWLLLGQGDMLEVGHLFTIQRETFAHVQAVLELEKFIPYMTPEELRTFEQSLSGRTLPVFSPDRLTEWQERVTEREREINARFAAANAKSDKLCRQQTAKK